MSVTPNDLNLEQRQVVETGSGPLMVIAGPGTGKTKTLTARIVHLLQTKQAKPTEILAVTFTAKAATEMRERVAAQLAHGNLPTITTFHAFCYELLQNNNLAAGRFATDTERRMLIAELPKPDSLRHLSNKELSLLISRFKNAVDHTSFDPALGRLTARYNLALTQVGLQDFDDLLVEAYRVLQADQTIRRTVQARCKYLLVDEFQDTNELQYKIMRLCAGQNILVIGDPLQSIYAFRGAQGAIFDQFAADYPQAKTVTLKTNYRSNRAIVALAKTLYPKLTLQTHSQQHGRVTISKTLHEYAEAAFIINSIESRLGGTNLLKVTQTNDDSVQGFCDFAIMYRTHHVARTIKRQLAESGIPYQVVGDESPYARPVPAAIIRLLLWVLASKPIDEQELKTLAALKKISLARLTERVAVWQASQHSVTALAQTIIDELGLSVTSNEDQQALRQCHNMLVQFGADTKACAEHVQQLAQSDYYDPRAEAVTLLTIHAAKGLEFAHVFLCAAEEGIIPHNREGTMLDEERRLLYVAVTRAKQQLDILYTSTRNRQPAKPSRFISNLPGYAHQEDPATAVLQKKHARKQLKRRQKTLFDF